MRADRREDRRVPKRALHMMLIVGVGLLWPIPVGGALLMVTAGFGLAILAETELGEALVVVNE